MKKQIEVLEKLCKKAYKNDEVPVAALIMYNDKIIAKAYNKRNKSNNVLDHAEIIAIRRAVKKMKSWRLEKCDLYVTMCPCEMCKSVINETRINNVFYLFENDKKKKNKTNYCLINNDSNEYFKKLLTSFFKNKRCKKTY